MANARALRSTVTLTLSRDLSPAAISARLAAFARRDLGARISAGQVPPVYTRVVDGRVGAPEESVRAGGDILYLFDYTAQVVSFVAGFLLARSPISSGRFRSSFFISVNGAAPAPLAGFDATTLRAKPVIYIGNTQPYDRKIDVQLTGRRALHYSVPAGMYDDCVRAIVTKFGYIVTAKRLNSLDFPGRYVLRGGKNPGDLVDSPGLVITPRG